jgi:enamine deaminase RidA (YjgF/YER057c/UK114 family)
MSGRVEQVLAAKGVELPQAMPPKVGHIEGTALMGNALFVSGQIPQWNGEHRFIGKAGADFSLEEVQAAARLSALNVLAQAKAALGGDLDRVKRVVKLTGYVNAHPDFHDVTPAVNGASDLMIEVFGEAGRHARTAVGVAVMPFNVAIEVEGIFEIAAGTDG